MITVLFVSLFVLFILGVPVAVSLGLSSALALFIGGDTPLLVLAQQSFLSLNSFTLLAIPLFVLAGVLMEFGGISQRLIDLANALAGRFSGGLAIVTVITTMFFAAISGSSVAATAALGGILIPAMINRGYEREFAGNVQAVSGTMGVIIPPSIPMILYGVTVGVSVGDLFIAGIIPGVVLGVGLMITIIIISKKRKYKIEQKKTGKELWKIFWDSIPALMMPLIILGGIYGGIFTATEAAGVAVLYAFLVSAFIYRVINLKNILEVINQAVLTTAAIVFIIASAGLFGWILTIENVPQNVAQIFISFSDNPYVFLSSVVILLIVAGMFIETNASIIILAPILAPVAIELGVDPIHFGVVVIFTLALGLVTPPLGLNLFITGKIANIRMDQQINTMFPFYIALLVVLLLVVFIPSLSTGIIGFLD